MPSPVTMPWPKRHRPCAESGHLGLELLVLAGENFGGLDGGDQPGAGVGVPSRHPARSVIPGRCRSRWNAVEATQILDVGLVGGLVPYGISHLGDLGPQRPQAHIEGCVQFTELRHLFVAPLEPPLDGVQAAAEVVLRHETSNAGVCWLTWSPRSTRRSNG